MSNQIKGFIVTLSRDISEERAAKLRDAILFFHDVADVSQCETDYTDHMARQMVRCEIGDKLWKALST